MVLPSFLRSDRLDAPGEREVSRLGDAPRLGECSRFPLRLLTFLEGVHAPAVALLLGERPEVVQEEERMLVELSRRVVDRDGLALEARVLGEAQHVAVGSEASLTGRDAQGLAVQRLHLVVLPEVVPLVEPEARVAEEHHLPSATFRHLASTCRYACWLLLLEQSVP